MDDFARLLEGYLHAKDDNLPHVINNVFAPHARLTFSLATQNIAFPSQTDGAAAIAKTLVTDFGAQYHRCRTYCVSRRGDLPDVPRAGTGPVSLVPMPWLVVMQERAGGALRVGHGVYRWTFDRVGGDWRVSALHIHIARMDVLGDAQADAWRVAIQHALPYPWVDAMVLRAAMARLAAGEAGLGWLAAFGEPAGA
ncbi:nuclear transport factor 2 family protein [Ralstonia solanacearum]|uniref:nuclear transport factor 2 family protein n=1 Tax=Ralstonia solanacearum TaxID=305 RepID=UPI0006DD0BFC|nr:nuclear transport factor 2 family protein [Ralstonia solanacearum]